MAQPLPGEEAFRIRAPNSIARVVLVISLDPASRLLIAEWNEEAWREVFFADGVHDDAFTEGGWRSLLDGRRFDVVIMIGSIGCDPRLADEIGARCARDSIKLGCVLFTQSDEDGGEEDWHLGQIRPWVRTLSIVRHADMIPGMLHALGG